VQISVKVSVTIERLERAIAVTAYCMTKHNLPQLLPTLKRLEAERDNLIANGDPNPGVEGKLIDVPVGHAIAARIISDQRMVGR
jgi:hypothetical protein